MGKTRMIRMWIKLMMYEWFTTTDFVALYPWGETQLADFQMMLRKSKNGIVERDHDASGRKMYRLTEKYNLQRDLDKLRNSGYDLEDVCKTR